MGDKFSFSWKNDSLADGYIIKIKKGNQYKELVRITNKEFTKIVVPDLKKGEEYHFKVSYYRKTSNGYSIYKNKEVDCYATQNELIVYGFPIPNLKKAERVEHSAIIEWEKVSDEVSYVVARRVPGGVWKRIGLTKENYYIDSNINMGQKYIYTVRCVNDDGKINLSSCCYRGISIEEW